MWSFVGATATARWLWHAIDHRTGRVLAYALLWFWRRKLLSQISLSWNPSSLTGFPLTSRRNTIGNSVAVHDRGLKRNEAICVSGHSRDATAIHGRRTKVSRALYALETNLCLQIDVTQ